ncbi:MAG: SUF system NifU family Fe-S cluster assembly protein [Clostridiales bacterium]|nr:SUF system NifU family Fe-S cluster assembly protein [Clostridiales bacterium]
MGLEDVYTQIIMEHNASGKNKHHIDSPNVVLKGVNPSCGDEITLELRIKDGKIEDAAFTGIGCAISQASTSIMIDLIKGGTVEEAKAHIKTFMGMIRHEITDEQQLETLDEAVALKNISHMPSRVKCAVLGWHTLEDALQKKS